MIRDKNGVNCDVSSRMRYVDLRITVQNNYFKEDDEKWKIIAFS